jgi:UDP-glucose 4-epimerase
VKVLVTGAAGFIGSHVVDRLLRDGHSILGFDDLSTGREDNLAAARSSGRFELRLGDVASSRDRDDLVAFAPDVVCHLAALADVRQSVADPVSDARVNILGTIEMLEVARLAASRTFVFVSSGGSIHGTPARWPVTETAPLAPESPYAASKAAAELWLRTYRSLYGLRWTSLALANVYGPRQRHDGEGGVVSIFAAALAAGRTATIFGDGSQTRDFVYVGDVADAFASAVAAPGCDTRMNVGTGAETSVLELYHALAALAGVASEPVFAPARLGELQRSALDAGLARRTLQWVPASELEVGLARTLDWVRESLA